MRKPILNFFMSRVGKLPIKVPSNVKVSLGDNLVALSNGKHNKSYPLSHGVEAKLEDGVLKLTVKDKANSIRLGTDRSNLNNLISGLQSAFKTTLEINGVGYKASVDKHFLVLSLGYSHEIVYALPNGIHAAFEKPNLINITGEDKVLVGQVASEIISFRKPEPYKGKGVKVQGKKILRKEGKKK